MNTKTVTPKPLSSVVSNIQVSAIKRIQLLANEKKDVVSLAQGTPSFFTPDHIKKAAIAAIEKNVSDKYTPGYGIAPLREAIAKKVTQQNGIVAKPENVLVGHGAIEVNMAVYMTLLNPDDEMIILTPDYASHITQAKIAMHGGIPVAVPLDETPHGWVLNPDRLEKAVTKKTKVILICNPCNPTGKVYSKEELKEVARIAAKYNIYIVTDEMYEDFVYDGKEHISIGSFPEVKDLTISIFGFSKSYSMTGWRVGYMIGSERLVQEIFKIHDSMVTCPTAVSQYAAIAALTGPKDEVWEFKKAYDKRRHICMEELQKTDKLEVIKPEGAYYIMPKFKKPVDDFALCFEMVEKAGVALVPGSAFGQGGENHVRISFCFDEEQLRTGLQRFVSYINKNL